MLPRPGAAQSVSQTERENKESGKEGRRLPFGLEGFFLPRRNLALETKNLISMHRLIATLFLRTRITKESQGNGL